MEYERHSDRLVLGFLKNNCISAYKAFLKHNFQNQGKHINTRVAGQNLEDILRVYSRIFEIVQGHIEDTNYPIEHGNEKLSPMFLAEQLLYLLDHPPAKSFQRSRRASTDSSITESHVVDNEEVSEHVSDVETTPENSLPGNVRHYPNHKSYNDRIISRQKPTVSRPDKVIVNKEVLSEVMSEKLLQNTEFQQKLANTITTVLNSPVNAKKHCDTVTAELDTTIRSVLQRTEADPMFEEVLQEFLDGPVVNTSNKPAPNAASSDRHVPDRRSASKCSSTHTERFSESSDLNEAGIRNPETKNSFTAIEVPNTSNMLDTSSYTPVLANNNTIVQPIQAASTPSNNPIYINPTRNGLFVVPPSYYVISQPISMPNCQPVLMPALETTPQQGEFNSSATPGLISHDSGPLTGQIEARNIQEFLTMYDDAKPSPLVKQQPPKPQTGLRKVIYPRKRGSNLQARPTVKVEILHVNPDDKRVPSTQQNEPSTSTNKSIPVECSTNISGTTQLNSCTSKSMPCVEAPKEQDNMKNCVNQENNQKELEVSNKEIPSDPKLITPSPSITSVEKRTPRSGSHIRNLTFPSPVKDSRMSRSSDAKLCAEKTDAIDTMSLPICWDAGLRMFVDPIIPKKNESSKSAKKKRTPKKVAKATELNVTDEEGRLLEQALKTPKDTKKGAKNKEQDVIDTEDHNGKKVLSPSKLNASKRNLLYENEVQKLQEETPMKDFPITPGFKSETPFTPMLQANLKEITGGDIFSIDTPNFPVTPGLSFMASSTNYYIFQDEDKAPNNDIKKSEDKVVEENKEAVEKNKRKNEEILENKTKKPRMSPKKKSKTPKKSTPKLKKSTESSKKRSGNVENNSMRKRQTRSTVLSKLRSSKVANSPRNDSDDQYNFFKASGTNLHRKKNQVPEDGSKDKEKLSETELNNELHMALVTARQDFTICHYPEESHSYAHDGSSMGTNTPYDASILDKKRKVTVFSAQDEEIKIILSATKFSSLLDIVESRDDGCSGRERRESSSNCGEPLAVRSAKRRSRSDSNSSHHSASAKKKDTVLTVNTNLLKDININSFLTQIHGHES